MAEKRLWIRSLQYGYQVMPSEPTPDKRFNEYVHIAEVQRLIRKAYSEGESDYAETGRCMKWGEAG